jgi:serine phosphatase RsbU (regulator of sigma subunit)
LVFTLFIEVRPGDYADLRSSLAGILSWSAALSLGATAVWVSVLGIVSHYLYRLRHRSASMRWNHARNLSLELTEITAGLIALIVYRRMGGATIPFVGEPDILIPALVATATRYLLGQLFSSPVLLYWLNILKDRTTMTTLARYLAVAIGLPILIEPFAVLAAVLYAEVGLGSVLFFSGGVLLTSLLANRLSGAAMRSRQRARELERLERLGRDIIRTPVDASTLSAVLEDHLSDMLPSFHLAVRLFPDQVIYRRPEGYSPVPEEAWEWLRTTSDAHCFLPGEGLPWADQPSGGDSTSNRALITAPILEPDADEAIGGIALAQQTRMIWEADEVTRSLPAVRTLASQIGSALHGAKLYRMEQELALAGQIQASFLPDDLPDIPGWQIAAALQPARQTAGDFYDVIPLPNGRFGIVIADVADKGMGAALYMALSRTLLRTYALEYHSRPDFALKVTNRRILMDTDVTMFVTVFYGILDPRSGELVYCNAGHNPPFLLRAGDGGEAEPLTKTGMALGAMAGRAWGRGTVQVNPKDVLLLYTDGITDAQNDADAFFGQERLLRTAQAYIGCSAHEIQDALVQAVRTFAGETSQFDDMTLVIAVRDT